MDPQQRRNDILRIAAQSGARNLRVFGSVARGDDRGHSEVDLLVDIEPDRGFLDIAGLSQDLEELLDSRVDGRLGVEFSFDGTDEGDRVSGRGWAVLRDHQLQGRLLIHHGDDSTFTARPAGVIGGASDRKRR